MNNLLVDINYPFQANTINHLWIFTDWGKIFKKILRIFWGFKLTPKSEFLCFYANLPYISQTEAKFIKW